MISHRPPQLRQVPLSGPTFALRSWVVGAGGAPEVVPEWLRQMRESALEHLDAKVQIVRRTFGLSSLRTRTVLSETVIKTTKGRLQRGATQVNASEATQQGGVRRTEGYVLRLPVGTPIPTDGKVIITRGAERFEFEITGHDPIRSESVLLTVWIAATNGITK